MVYQGKSGNRRVSASHWWGGKSGHPASA